VSKSGHAGTGFADQRLPLSQTPRDPIKWRLWQIAQDREKPVSRIVERRGGATSENRETAKRTGDRQAASKWNEERINWADLHPLVDGLGIRACA
jgi:hypothetical protein